MFGKCIASTIGAVAFALSAHASQSENLTTVRYQEYPGSMSHLVNWVMREKGFCAKEGLKCEPVYLASGPLATQAAAAGSVDIILSSVDQLFLAIANGNDLQLVSNQQTDHNWTFSVRKGFPQPNGALGYPGNMADFRSARVGVTARGSGTEMTIKSLFASAGISTSDVSFVAVGGPTTAYQALLAKQIDAVMSWDPLPQVCNASGKCNVAVDLRRREGPRELLAMNGIFNPWAARRSYIEAHEPIVDAYVRALSEAMAWVKDRRNFPEVFKIAKKHIKLGDIVPDPDKVMETSLKEMIGSYGTKLDRGAVKGVSDFLISHKMIDKPLDPEVVVYRNAP